MEGGYMRLFHVITTYHLISAMTLQAASDEETVLIAPKWIELKYPKIHELTFLFSEVHILDTGYRHRHTFEETQDYYNSIILPLESYSEIYLWGAQSGFGMYVAESDIPFIFCEEATGMLSRPEILQHLDYENPNIKHNYERILNLGLYTGEGQNVKAILCNMEAQTRTFDFQDIIDYRVVDALKELPEQDRTRIIRFFIDFNKIHVEPDCTVIFTQHLASLLTMTYEEQIRMYQLLVDYFFPEESIVIKPHPDDLICYSELFPDAQIIHERFPSEFFPFVLDNRPKGIATVYSTAIYNLRGQYDNVFELDLHFEKDFFKIHRYYCALQTISHVGNTVYCYGFNEVMLDKINGILNNKLTINLLTSEEMNSLEDGFLLIDEMVDQGCCEKGYDFDYSTLLEKGVSVIFLNAKEDYRWYSYHNKDLFADYAMPLRIRKQMHAGFDVENLYEPLKDETMYFISMNGQIREKIRTMRIQKELPHLGVNIDELPICDQEERIAVLEGMLKATEERLLFYMNKVNELEKVHKA